MQNNKKLKKSSLEQENSVSHHESRFQETKNPKFSS